MTASHSLKRRGAFRGRRRRRIPVREEASPERIEQGEGGERALQNWLDRSRLAYLFLDQTPLTIPATLRADLKRPDFVVAVAGMGPVAIDAKAKAFIDGHFVLDASERRRLDGFESHFSMPVWYACFPPAEARLCYLFRNRALMGSAVFHDSARRIVRAPLSLGLAVEPASTTFAAALARADDTPRVMPAPAGPDPSPFERCPLSAPAVGEGRHRGSSQQQKG